MAGMNLPVPTQALVANTALALPEALLTRARAVRPWSRAWRNSSRPRSCARRDQLSDWRRHARQGLLAVPAEILTDLPAPQGPEPMFGMRRFRPIDFAIAARLSTAWAWHCELVGESWTRSF